METVSPGKIEVQDVKVKPSLFGGKTAFDKARSGDRYYFPTPGNRVVILTVLNKNREILVAKHKRERIYFERDVWDASAVPLPGIKVIDINPDPDNKLIFVRYRYEDNIVDKFYNWLCKFKKKVEI